MLQSDPKLCCIIHDGTTWTESNLSYTGDFRKVVAGQDAYVAMSNATNTVSFSYDGESWVTRSLPLLTIGLILHLEMVIL